MNRFSHVSKKMFDSESTYSNAEHNDDFTMSKMKSMTDVIIK